MKTGDMPSDECNYNASSPMTRLDKLLNEPVSHKSSHPNEEVKDNEEANSTQGDDQTVTDNSECPHSKDLPDGITIPRILDVPECGRKRRDAVVHRLLVVANRLPVSAIRRGEEEWELEVSAGGLVSALLGKCQFYSLLSYFGYILHDAASVIYSIKLAKNVIVSITIVTYYLIIMHS